MAKIELIRRKAEHNENEIGTLEELSLHQENIEKIEYLQNWCRHLQILLMQSNLISRMENLGKLKKLRYLNLALNNIERVENLEGLESLEKLDLTLNFIGDIASVASLRANIHLKYLILTGNPCADFQNYCDFVITKLPQIHELDCREIIRSERLVAKQNFDYVYKLVLQQQEQYLEKRREEKEQSRGDEEVPTDDSFWNKPSKNTPEERIAIANMAEKSRKRNNSSEKGTKKDIKLCKNGKPLNINQGKIPFRLYDDESGEYIVLDIAVYRYLDTSYITVDVQPTHVYVNIKGKVLQIVLADEINTTKTTCRRSQTTGHMEIRMPRMNFSPKMYPSNSIVEKSNENAKRCLLEVKEPKNIFSIVEEEYLEDPSIPPLE